MIILYTDWVAKKQLGINKSFLLKVDNKQLKEIRIHTVVGINPIQDGPFRSCSRGGKMQKGPLPKICHTCPTMMKIGTIVPYLKKIQNI